MGSRTFFTAIAAVAPFVVLAAVAPAPPAQDARPRATEVAAEPGAVIAMPIVRAEYSGQAIVLSGTVPDAAERDAIVLHARSIYGAAQVTDRLQIGPVANPAWLNPAFLPDLRGALHAVAVLDDARLTIEGLTPTAQAQAALSAAVRALAARGIRIDNRMRLLDPSSPAAATRQAPR